jgi:hypothetical protein
MPDLIQRLRDADPLPEAERLTPAEQHEADSLLARLVAEPIAPRPRPRARRWALAAGAACVVALAVGAVSLLDDNEGAPGVAARAAAAVSDEKAIYHTVWIGRATAADSRPRRSSAWFESWDAPDGSTRQKLFRVEHGHRGRLVGEMAGRLRPKGRGRFGGALLTYDARENTIRHTRFGRSPIRGRPPTISPGADPGSSLKSLQAQGRLHLAGKARVGNRDAYRLVSGPVPGFMKGTVDRYEYLVDSETYYPLLLHFENESIRITERFLVYERLPFDASHRELLKLDPHPGAKEYSRDGRLLTP